MNVALEDCIRPDVKPDLPHRFKKVLKKRKASIDQYSTFGKQ